MLNNPCRAPENKADAFWLKSSDKKSMENHIVKTEKNMRKQLLGDIRDKVYSQRVAQLQKISRSRRISRAQTEQEVYDS